MSNDNSAEEEDSPDESPDVDEGFHAIVSADVLETTLNNTGVLVDECRIHYGENGLDIRAVDPANVGMVDQSLLKEAFESYAPGTGDGGIMGVDLTKLQDIVNMADSDDLIDMRLDQETRKLHVSMDGLEYTLALIDPDAIREEPDIPDLDLPGVTVLEGKELGRGITAADMVSDHIELRTSGDDSLFEVIAEGDTDDVHLELGEDALIEVPGDDADALFSLDYLKDMNKAIPKDAALKIELGVEMPMKMHYEFADGLGTVTYMLAPRIQSD